MAPSGQTTYPDVPSRQVADSDGPNPTTTEMPGTIWPPNMFIDMNAPFQTVNPNIPNRWGDQVFVPNYRGFGGAPWSFYQLRHALRRLHWPYFRDGMTQFVCFPRKISRNVWHCLLESQNCWISWVSFVTLIGISLSLSLLKTARFPSPTFGPPFPCSAKPLLSGS